MTVSTRSVERLSVYRRLLDRSASHGTRHVFSRELAQQAGVTPAQLRRDLMGLGYTGSTAKGYRVDDLLSCLNGVLDAPDGTKVALVGVGNLGRAVLAFFAGRNPRLSIVAAFDNDSYRTDRLIVGCPCHPMEQLPEIVRQEGIRAGIITVPAVAAQQVAEQLVEAGVQSLLNFAPTSLRVPGSVYVESMDISIALERVAYFARHGLSAD